MQVSLFSPTIGLFTSAIATPVLLLVVSHCGTGVRRAAVTSMTLSHLVDGRNQISRSAGIINTFSVDFTNSLISPNDTRQTNYVVIQIVFLFDSRKIQML
jgi:hypothetical protein